MKYNKVGKFKLISNEKNSPSSPICIVKNYYYFGQGSLKTGVYKVVQYKLLYIP
jgi:hypothetical protein